MNNIRALQRVKSKNLFNFKQQGKLDADVVAAGDAFKKFLQDQNTLSRDTDIPPDEQAEKLRCWYRRFFPKLAKHPVYVNAVENCDHREISVPVRDGNDVEVKVLVHTPRHMSNKKNNVGVLYAHGGGAIAGTAELYKPMLSALAIKSNIVIFNVDYRLAPETKCPTNILDFYCALKHIQENADNLGIDADKVGISGESGGGYICFGTMVKLAMKNESHLVKAALPIIPMISDYVFSDPCAMTEEERDSVGGLRSNWRALAQNIDQQWGDPLLFPSKSPDCLIQKMPPTVIFSAEFDIFVTETERMARRMRSNGRLLDFCSLPGCGHGSYFNAALSCHQTFHTCYSQAVEQYLVNNIELE